MMRVTGIVALCGATLLLAVGPGEAAVRPASTFAVAMRMHDGDRLLATPQLAVSAGEPSTVDIGTVPGTRYTMRFSLAPRGGNTVALASNIRVSVGGRVSRAAPRLLVRYGEPASIAFRDGDGTPFRVDLNVRPLR